MKRSRLIQIIKQEIKAVLLENPLKPMSGSNKFPNVAKEVERNAKRDPTCNELDSTPQACIDEVLEDFNDPENHKLFQAIEDDLTSSDLTQVERGRRAYAAFWDARDKGGYLPPPARVYVAAGYGDQY